MKLQRDIIKTVPVVERVVDKRTVTQRLDELTAYAASRERLEREKFTAKTRKQGTSGVTVPFGNKVYVLVFKPNPIGAPEDFRIVGLYTNLNVLKSKGLEFIKKHNPDMTGEHIDVREAYLWEY